MLKVAFTLKKKNVYMWMQDFPGRQVGRQKDINNYQLSYIFHKGNASSICFESIERRKF